MDWQTEPPPIGIELEFVTTDGKEMKGEVSFLAAHDVGEGRIVRQYMLRPDGRPVFEVARWRRAKA